MATPRSKARTGEVLPPPDDEERQAQAAIGRQMMQYPDPDIYTPELPAEDDPDDIALANVIADLGGPGVDAKVNVYQLDANRNKAFVRSYLPAEFSLENVQSEYGPGDYEIHVRKDGKLATRKVLKIATPKNTPTLQPMQVDNSRAIMETMQNGFKEMGAMFANALAGLAANQPKPKTTMEMLQEMTMMRELMGGNQPPATSADPLAMVEMAMNLAEKIQPRVGEPGTGEVILEAIKNFGPLLGKAAAQAQTQSVSMPPQLQHNPAPIPDSAIPQGVITVPQQPPQETEQMNLARKMYLNLLVKNAEVGNDTLTYANLMLDVAGEDEAIAFANRPDWFETLCVEEPRAANLRPWFDQLRNDILELTKPEDTGISTGTPPEPAP